MAISDGLISEMQHEAQTTRRIFERIPESTWDWKPHEKSMTMLNLAAHIAEMHGWIGHTVKQPELDFATMDYQPFKPDTTAELVEFFDKQVAESIDALKGVSDEQMYENWKLRRGEKILMDVMKIQAVRGMVYNHIFHHRGQLSVYLRMNDIPVPAMYGPSADENTF